MGDFFCSKKDLICVLSEIRVVSYDHFNFWRWGNIFLQEGKTSWNLHLKWPQGTEEKFVTIHHWQFPKINQHKNIYLHLFQDSGPNMGNKLHNFVWCCGTSWEKECSCVTAHLLMNHVSKLATATRIGLFLGGFTALQSRVCISRKMDACPAINFVPEKIYNWQNVDLLLCIM